MINQEKLFLNTEKVLSLRGDFPLLKAHPGLIYFDNSATTQKPQAVLWAEQNWYTNLNANPGRGMYDLGARATAKYEWSRARVAQALGANPEEVIFTSGATAGLNMAAMMLSDWVAKEDEIVVSIAEHHSNLLVWRRVAQQRGAKIVSVGLDENECLTSENICKAMSPKTKIVAVTGMSNVLGQKVDIAKVAARAHEVGALVVMDGTQLIAHEKINVADCGVDVLAFSGHKIYGPLGIGVLFVKRQLAEKLSPALVGGGMIGEVSQESVTWAPLPHKLEAGTVNGAGAAGLVAALDYLEELGWTNILAREKMLTEYVIKKLQAVPGVRILGSQDPDDHAGVVSFVLAGVHAHDVATILARESIAVRAGHHCAAPLHETLGVSASVRVSLCWYNLTAEIDRLVDALASVRGKMGI